jgi:DNA-binding MarR family transcriptional regulator
MPEARASSADALAEAIAHLGRLTSGDGSVRGMTAAQWAALRYFARANRFSRTVSAFAEFHATTRGTASQTVKGLVGQGYLSRTRSSKDGRSAVLAVTEKGRAVLAGDPFEILIRATAKLPARSRSSLADLLARVLADVAAARRRRPFGVCSCCAHLRCDGCGSGGPSRFACAFVGETLDSDETRQLCLNHQPPPGHLGKARGDRQASA